MKAKIGVLLLSLISLFAAAQSEIAENLNNNSCGIYIPEMFEPNVETGEILDFETLGVLTFEMKIFNHWGLKVLESSQTASVKSGLQSLETLKLQFLSTGADDVKYNNELDSGVYYYSVSFICADGDFFENEGSLQLLRTEHK